MTLRRCGQFLFSLIWIAAGPLVLAAAPDLSRFQTMLEKHAGLDRESVEKLQARRVVARLLETRKASEVACLGAAVIAVRREYFLSQFRDIVNFKKGPEVLQVGILGRLPTVSDVQKLNLTQADIEALNVCRPGDCKVKLSVPMMAQISKRMRDSQPVSDRGDAAFRAALVDYVRRYLSDGDRALVCYASERPEVCVANVLNELLDEFSLLQEYAPGLYGHLEGSRPVPTEGPDSFLYWSEERFGPLKPIVSVTQVMIHSKELDGAPWSFIASKQIYASHYFRASLGLTVLVDIGQGSVLMLYFNRSEFDGLGGWLGAVKRAIVRHQLRSGMEQNVARLRTKLEQSYRHAERPE